MDAQSGNDRRLTKLVRANLLFTWLHKWFPEFGCILLLRHPAAVILSQLNGGWNLSSARLNAQSVLRDPARLERFDDYGLPEEGFASNLLFRIIENEVTMECAKTNRSPVLHYESLCMNPGDRITAGTHPDSIGKGRNLEISGEIDDLADSILSHLDADWARQQAVQA